MGKKYGYKSVTICEKPNVLRETSGMMEDEAKAVAKEYPGIALWSTNIDAQTMWLTKNPEEYGVVVASNLFGDVISDAFAGLIGGLGFAASGNIGDEVAVFEPTHGSAPKYAELDPPIVNPIAMFLSASHDARARGRIRKGPADPRGDCRGGQRRQSPDLRHDADNGRRGRYPPGRRQHNSDDRCRHRQDRSGSRVGMRGLGEKVDRFTEEVVSSMEHRSSAMIVSDTVSEGIAGQLWSGGPL